MEGRLFGCLRGLLSNLLLLKTQRQLSIMHASQDRGGLERSIQPDIQVPIDKQLLPDQRYQIRQRPSECGFQLQVLQDQHGYKLSPTREPSRVPLGLVFLNCLLELPATEHLQ
jgi:hypothetical protein